MTKPTDANPRPRCCVFQPFDNKGPFDKRFDDIIKPALESLQIEAYRVDRDNNVVIPIETLHEEIQTAALCLADITTVNPNVMYELGYAIASKKDVVIICSSQAPERFPFDVQHRKILRYASDSVSDFDKLANDIKETATALLRKQDATRTITESPVRATDGMKAHEINALALIIANVQGAGDTVTSYEIKNAMEQAGFTPTATQLALRQLARLGFVEQTEVDDNYNHETYIAYRLTKPGEDWLLENQHLLALRADPPVPRNRRVAIAAVAEDDIPF